MPILRIEACLPLSETLKNTIKLSPGKWLTERRLKRAKAFLETTDKSISQVAFDCGFSNLSHFSRSYKAEYGMSPSAYRRDWADK
ncbi:helix-turn-helix domain-containing protein [Rhodohalobacter sp.]|uniref:helix-turn-helix domain-containing protein n=1 Tax=Rhodohalobacter sp. TaxID=1974210 RepID=UPI003A100624